MRNAVKDLTKQRVHVITMGCAKNVVDSEKLMAQLKLSNIELSATIEDADIAVINTCGFIAAAKQESIDVIIENVKRKSRGKLKKVYAMGCLTERYREDLIKEIPEVDAFFGSNQMKDVVQELGGDYKYELLGERTLTTPSHFAYLKISEGCDNPCSFCAIPIMRGLHVSKTVEDLVSEAQLLASRGVKELVVIGQDTTYYGLDIYQQRRLPELLERLADINGIEWVRLMYAYPAKFPKEILKVIARHPNICKYMDMPIQHVADEVLKSMRRGISKRGLKELLAEIREQVPDITLRTTIIVGYPAEGEREFDELLEFVTEEKFDRLGVFTYSQEDGTTAFPLADPIPEVEKEHRKAAIMEAQREISEEKNAGLIGSVQRVLVERKEGDQYVGRTAADAPEIDNEVYISGSTELQTGSFHEVEVVNASEYDLYGRLQHERSEPTTIAV
ncbi:MAG: 30S ribosomal protein S12 methylthiotransferase RimO [Bacteroidota bacterium]